MKKQFYACLSVVGFLFANCSQQVINLKSDSSPETFILQLDKADLHFTKGDVLEAAANKIKEEKAQASKTLLQDAYSKVAKSKIGTTSFPIKLPEDIQDNTTESAHLLVHEVYYQLLKAGQVKIFNKATKAFEPKAFYKKQKSALGQRGEVFYFKDGTEFYYHVISFGE